MYEFWIDGLHKFLVKREKLEANIKKKKIIKIIIGN